MDIFNKQKLLNLEQELQKTQYTLRQRDNTISQLNQQLNHYKSLVQDEHKTKQDLEQAISKLEKRQIILDNAIKTKREQLDNIEKDITTNQSELSDLNDKVHIQMLGLYPPNYKYATSQEYQNILSQNRLKQKEILKSSGIVYEKDKLAIEGNIVQGNILLKSMSHLMLTAFNLQCETLIDKVNHANVEEIKSRILKLIDKIEKNGKIFELSISKELVDLKINELYLVYEKALKSQEEKEERAYQKKILQEQERVEKEILKQKIELEKEKNALFTKMDRLVNEEDKNKIRVQIEQLSTKIQTNEHRLANQRGGWLYIISNNDLEGNPLKLGVSRRLQPQDRVDELSDASHSFKFNVHAFIWSEDVFKLESDLHKYFADKRVNLINSRKELFYVSLDEVEQVLKEQFGIDVVLNRDIVDEDYLASEAIRKNVK